MALTTRKGTAFANPSKATRQQIPPFLSKLYHMVNDSNTDALIRWSDAGDSFYVYDHERFAKDVLPHWFKHGNFGSFVRQLNNYGFHKVPQLQQGVLRSDGETEISHFENQHFQRGQSDLLCLIQRKKQTQNDAREESPDINEPITSTSAQANGAESEPARNSHNIKGTVLDINGVLTGVQAIKRHQHAISAELKELHQSNQGLWQEAFAARERHKKHHDTITRILKFLAGVFGQTQGSSSHAQEVPHDASDDPSSSTAIVPRRQNRLMIENGLDLEGKATEVLNGMHLNMDDFMEPLDFEGGQANDGERFATIETPGSPCSPGPSISKLESLPDAPSPHSFPSKVADTTSQPLNKAAGTYSFPPPKHNRIPSTDLSQVVTPDFSFPTDISSSPITPHIQSDHAVQNAFSSILNNPAQLQRVLTALQTHLPVSIPPDPGSESVHISREIPSPPPFNFRPPADGQLSPGSTLSLLSAASHMGALSIPNGEDAATLSALTQTSNQLQMSYKDAGDVEADVNALQGHIDSLIESLGLDRNTTAVLRGEQQHTDDEIVSSIETDAHPLPPPQLSDVHLLPPPQLSDVNPDFDFSTFLSQDFDTMAGLGGLGQGSVTLDATTHQNGAERLGAFLDEVRSVSNEPENVTGGSIPDNEPVMVETIETTPGKTSKKRKSQVAEVEEASRTKMAKTKKKR